MATIKLRNINPVVFNNNVGLGDVSPSERLVVNNGIIKLDHANGGQGLFFQSLSTNGNNSSIRWFNNAGTERFRLIVDPTNNKTDKLQINSNNNNTNCLTILQDGKIGIGTGTTAPTAKLSVISDVVGYSVYANFGPTTMDSSTREGGIQIHSTAGSDKTWGIWADANSPTALRFEYLGARATEFDSGTDTISLHSDGKVGIGTGSTAPTEVLTINSASNTRILLQEAGNDRGSITAGGNGLYIRNLSGRILFRNSSDVDTMAIWNDGKVGIGTGSTEPSTILNIHGADPIVRIVGTTADDNATIQLLEAQDIPKFGFELQYDGTGDNRFYIKKYNGSLTADVVLAIDRGTGDVGIGTGATLPAAKLDIYKQEGLLPVINARRGKDGGRIRLSYGSTTDNYGEIGMTSYSSGSKIWIGSNMNSFAASGHSSPAHADADTATWFSTWNSNADEFSIERISNGETAPKSYLVINTNGLTVDEDAANIMRAGKTNGLALWGGKEGNQGDGCNIIMYGSEHPTKANYFEIRRGGTVVLTIKGGGTINLPSLATSNQDLAAGDLYRSGNDVLVAT